MKTTETLPAFAELTDLISERIGGKVLEATDDFFAEKENLIKPGRGVFIADKFTDRGKWMDGWETQRKRIPGHDWVIIQFAAPGIIRGFNVDTNYFLGNHPPFCSIEVCYAPDHNLKNVMWTEILPQSPLNPGSQNFFEITNNQLWTHLKFHIYPDGGVARLRVHGEIKKDWNVVKPDEVLDLASVLNGARAIACNDMFFSHIENLILPTRGINMGDGWETKRNRTSNNRDWVIIRLAHKGKINKITIDTLHFKGNYPESALIEGCISDTDHLENATWIPILSRQKLSAHHEHHFSSEILPHPSVTHVRMSIFPDGGVSRLRIWGTIDKEK